MGLSDCKGVDLTVPYQYPVVEPVDPRQGSRGSVLGQSRGSPSSVIHSACLRARLIPRVDGSGDAGCLSPGPLLHSAHFPSGRMNGPGPHQRWIAQAVNGHGRPPAVWPTPVQGGIGRPGYMAMCARTITFQPGQHDHGRIPGAIDPPSRVRSARWITKDEKIPSTA